MPPAGVFVALMLDAILAGPRGMFFDGESYRNASVLGGACGFLLGPAAAFGFLRRVPLGRLFAETALGAALGVCGSIPTRRALVATRSMRMAAGFDAPVRSMALYAGSRSFPSRSAQIGSKFRHARLDHVPCS